jgi:hypothetical protein
MAIGISNMGNELKKRTPKAMVCEHGKHIEDADEQLSDENSNSEHGEDSDNEHSAYSNATRLASRTPLAKQSGSLDQRSGLDDAEGPSSPCTQSPSRKPYSMAVLPSRRHRSDDEARSLPSPEVFEL